MASENARAPLVPIMPPGDVHQTTVVLNDFGGVTLDERTRTTGTGAAVRYTLSIKAAPILHELSPVVLGAKPAAAILDLIRKQHYAITRPAAPATIARRKRAARELATGGSSRLSRGKMVDSGDLVRRRYVPSRVKDYGPPGSGVTYGSDSNILYNGWFLRQNTTEDSFTVNVPANRFDPTTFNGGIAALQTFIARITELIPALRGDGILDNKEFLRAVATSSPVKLLTETWFDRIKDYAPVARAFVQQWRRVALAAGV